MKHKLRMCPVMNTRQFEEKDFSKKFFKGRHDGLFYRQVRIHQVGVW